MRSKNLICGLTLVAFGASGLALSHPVQAHERAYSAPRVIVVERGHGYGRYCQPRYRYYGKRHNGHRRLHDRHEYYRHHRERSHDGYRHGGHYYGDRDNGSIRFRIDYRDIL